MKILLIDVDSTIPNLALMKLSSYYQKNGYRIELIKCNISYYPKKQKPYLVELKEKYYKVFISGIFTNTVNKLEIKDSFSNDINYGGTGYDINKKLPEYIENIEPDYSIYPENDTSYGFITRGCIRNCYFCFVPKKEGLIKFVQHPKDIIKHKKVKFLDNNILAYKEHTSILEWLVDNKIRYQFNQGLDIRLINQYNSELFMKSNYLGELLFAFDDIKFLDLINSKIKNELFWVKPWGLKFFVYVHPDMEIKDTIRRIEYLYNNKCLPYIMRDLSCWKSKYSDFYTDLAAWCNQPNLFKKMSFDVFLDKRHKNIDRIRQSKEIYFSS